MNYKEPVLAEMPNPDFGKWRDEPPAYKVFGGLHYIRGNRKPYFSITSRNGCDHERILKRFPQFADLVALHMSDMDGEPIHGAGNGWYWLAGALSNDFGDEYHGGTGSSARPPLECLQLFADHCRVSIVEAAAIGDQVYRETMRQHDDRLRFAKGLTANLLAAMRPRWKAEADACIAKHGLVVYGDEWKGETK